ncbi:MAG: glycosyltransferase [Acidobacteriota bacterium]|jgi:trehalose synthase
MASPSLKIIEPDESIGLSEYAQFANLRSAVHDLQTEAATFVPQIGERTVWMVSSTAEGGGVAEMLPKLISILCELGVKTKWVVIQPRDKKFFQLTKRLHNLVHGSGDARLERSDRDLYESISGELADDFDQHLGKDDVLVVHDPQPLGMGAALKSRKDVGFIWRSHIGLDRTTPATQAAWEFLRPFAEKADRAAFSTSDYIPAFLAGRSSVLTPAIDPLSHKNRDLSPHKLVGILCNAGLEKPRHPVLTPAWEDQAQRLAPGGEFVPATQNEIGLLFRPIICQISRWDRLKGWAPLIKAFVALRGRLEKGDQEGWVEQVKIGRMVLAGPDPAGIQDDPEALEVVEELKEAYCGLDSDTQEEIAILNLPMSSRKRNALMVNALQQCSTIVVQNSLQEGFGLTATEAMWKRVPVLGTRACGLRAQIRDGVDGFLTHDPQNPEEIADNLARLLSDRVRREHMGRNGQRNVMDHYLVFEQVAHWLKLIHEMLHRRASPSKG